MSLSDIKFPDIKFFAPESLLHIPPLPTDETDIPLDVIPYLREPRYLESIETIEERLFSFSPKQEGFYYSLHQATPKILIEIFKEQYVEAEECEINPKQISELAKCSIICTSLINAFCVEKIESNGYFVKNAISWEKTKDGLIYFVQGPNKENLMAHSLADCLKKLEVFETDRVNKIHRLLRVKTFNPLKIHEFFPSFYTLFLTKSL